MQMDLESSNNRVQLFKLIKAGLLDTMLLVSYKVSLI